MSVPVADNEVNIVLVIPILKEMLGYCIQQILEENRGSLSYDGRTDEVVYHYRPDTLDSSLFDRLIGVEEIWIITKGADS